MAKERFEAGAVLPVGLNAFSIDAGMMESPTRSTFLYRGRAYLYFRMQDRGVKSSPNPVHITSEKERDAFIKQIKRQLNGLMYPEMATGLENEPASNADCTHYLVRSSLC